MDLTLIDTATARTTRTALTIAGIVAAYLALAALASVLVSTLAEMFAIRDLFLIGSQWASFAATIATSVVVFALGVFLVLWVVAPIAAATPLRLVIARAALAAAGGAVLTYLLDVFSAVIQSAAGRVFWDTAPDVSVAQLTVVDPIRELITTLVSYGPVVVLAAVLVWLQLRSRERVTGTSVAE